MYQMTTTGVCPGGMVGPVQDNGLQRLLASMSRDLDRAKQQGWSLSG
jgi:hypothetical protein